MAVAEVEGRCKPFEELRFRGDTLTGNEMASAACDAAIRAGVLADKLIVRVKNLPWGLIRAVAWAVPIWRELLEMR